jgi:uncharacterized membrane protein
MRGEDPIPSDDPPKQKPASTVSEEKSEQSDPPKTEEPVEMNILDQSRSLCSTLDLLVFLAVLIVLAVVWVFVYHQPIPTGILRFLGMDSTLYPAEVRQNQ